MLARSASRAACRAAASRHAAELHTGATVAVCGLGSMGHGVVQLCASAGYNVVAVDMNQTACDNALKHIKGSLTQLASKAVAKGTMDQATADASVSGPMARIQATTDVTAVAKADLIIEAIAENLVIKRSFFKRLGEIAKPGAIIATNTSSFMVKDMAEVRTVCGKTGRALVSACVDDRRRACIGREASGSYGCAVRFFLFGERVSSSACDSMSMKCRPVAARPIPSGCTTSTRSS